MISRETGRDIAGQKLIDKYGRDYLIKNKEKLSFIENIDEQILTVTFTLHKHLDDVSVERNEGIFVEEKHFPDTLLTVKVNLRDETVISAEE